MSIGAIAPRRPHVHRTIPPGALWCGRGMPVRLQSMAGRCGGSLSRPSRSPSPPGTPSPQACARTSTTISQVLLSSTAPLAASAFSRAARRRSRPGGPNLSQWPAWRFGSACRSRASPHWPRSSTPMSSNWSLTRIGKRTAKSRRPAPSIWAGRCCEWPARQDAWIKPHLNVSMRSGSRWNSIAVRV